MKRNESIGSGNVTRKLGLELEHCGVLLYVGFIKLEKGKGAAFGASRRTVASDRLGIHHCHPNALCSYCAIPSLGDAFSSVLIQVWVNNN